MSVRIELDKRGSAFTCLDIVTGKVILSLGTEETITSITVKMEGISRTRLPIPRRDGPSGPVGALDRELGRSEVEIHRLLYLVQTVFPPSIMTSSSPSTSSSGYTMKAGQYEYPFQLRIPINTMCAEPSVSIGGTSLFQKISFSETGMVDYAKDATRHVKGTLPPSLSGVPGDEAWIRYFLKVTINRSAFKRNIRVFDPFVFLPIEPPRQPPTTRETYAKRQHQFVYTPLPQIQKKRGLFGLKSNPDSVIPQSARFSIEARLPSPPILVPNDPLPLRIVLVKLEQYIMPVVIRSLIVNLYATTSIQAHGLEKQVVGVVNVLNLMNLRVVLGDEASPVGVELEADPGIWRRFGLPDTVPPSFRTCNIARSYQMEVVIGLSHGVNGHVDTIPLSLSVQVYSGIAPPQKLLDSHITYDQKTAFQNPPKPPRAYSTDTLKVPPIQVTSSGHHSAGNSPVSSPVGPAFPPRPHSSGGAPHAAAMMHGGGRPDDDLEDPMPPPTYEEAIVGEVGPVDGPRRRYEQDGAYYGALPEDVH